jgi:NAD(P)-dependent dehydrogenase (short-subunit alcohol dehydrogenase family)
MRSQRPFRAIVTGAASGIGRATAAQLNVDSIARSGQGAHLILIDIAAEALEAATGRLREEGAEISMFVADLTDPHIPEQIVGEVAKIIESLDALVSNAGIIRRASLLNLSLAEYEHTFAINTRATWLLAKAAHPLLKLAKGAIVATASLAAREPAPALGAYSASKAALVMLVQQMACDWGRDGIRANTVSPGSTLTNISRNAGIPAPREPRAPTNPLGFFANPEDQAAVIAFLAGPDARYITGADILVDGGARTQLMVASGMGDPWRRNSP